MTEYAKVREMVLAETRRLKAQGLETAAAQRQAAKNIQAQLQGKAAEHPAAAFYHAHREEMASASKTMPTLLHGRIVGPPDSPITTLTIQIPVHMLKWLEDYTARQRTLPETFAFNCLMHVIDEVKKAEKDP